MKWIIEPDAAYEGYTYFRIAPPAAAEWMTTNSHGWAERTRPMIAEAVWWCRDQFGPVQSSKRYGRPARWFATGYGIAVRDNVDATAFRVRWG